MHTLVVIPARGGSKEIPRKNLRFLGGKPLLAWSIEAALAAEHVDRVAVTTDSPEIAVVARRFGAEVVMRDPALAGDDVPLDPVVADAVLKLETEGEPFDLVVTVQPTSPLLTSETIDRIVGRLAEDAKLDTVLTVVDETHLSWEESDGRLRPAYEKRVNRQHLPRRYKETGGVLATRRAHVSPEGRFGPNVSVEVLSSVEGIDIDGADEWLFAEAALKRTRVAFVVIGNRLQGLGHVTRVRTLMESMSGHAVKAFCTAEQDLAIEALKSSFFPFEVVEKKNLLSALTEWKADIVVHDELETLPEDLRREREAGMRIVCFEDRGEGAKEADLVFDALYPREESDFVHCRVYGPEAYVLRDEFLFVPRHQERDPAERVLVTFGGTDPSGLTEKVLRAVGPECPITVTVVAGKGYQAFDRLEALCKEIENTGTRVELHRDVTLMSEVMSTADIAFSSSGRTLYELAYLGVPTIVLAQNDLELRHTFGSSENGFLYLGLGADLGEEAIRSSFQTLLSSHPLRLSLSRRMKTLDLESGRIRVVRSILEL